MILKMKIEKDVVKNFNLLMFLNKKSIFNDFNNYLISLKLIYS